MQMITMKIIKDEHVVCTSEGARQLALLPARTVLERAHTRFRRDAEIKYERTLSLHGLTYSTVLAAS